MPRLKWPPLLVVGLTGGIASGKTTVAGFFAELGATVINADHEGHAVLAPGEPAVAELVAHFGPVVLREDGSVDRRKLGERVFASAADRAILNRISHPRITARVRKALERLQERPPSPPIVVIEAALLVEAGWQSLVDKTLVIVAQPSTQVARLMAGPGMTLDQAEARLRAQLPLSRKLKAADLQINGEAPLGDVRRQVHSVWNGLREQLETGRPVRRGPAGLRVPTQRSTE
jgi:dephospho-CoA kinase